jgi:hypothetical protein
MITAIVNIIADGVNYIQANEEAIVSALNLKSPNVIRKLWDPTVINDDM